MPWFREGSPGSSLVGTRTVGRGALRYVATYSPPVVIPDTFLAACYGLGPFGEKVVRESYDTGIRTAPPEVGTFGLTFTTSRGDLFGIERAGIGRPNIVSIEWENRTKGGCKDAKIKLRELPIFELRNYMVVQIIWAGLIVYTGSARRADVSGSTLTGITIKLTGLGAQLANVREDITVSGPIDLGEAARLLFLAVQNETSIGYEAGLVNGSYGVVSSGDIELNKSSWIDVMNILSRAGNQQWGVNAAGKFYFLPRVHAVEKAYVVGYDLNDFNPERVWEYMSNQVAVLRSTVKGSGSSGLGVASVGNNPTSIADYDTHYKEYTMPGHFGDDVADAVRDAALADGSEPKWAAVLKGLPLVLREDYPVTRGPVRVIGAYGDQTQSDVQKCENLLDFTLVNTSGLSAISIDQSTVYAGAGSLKYVSTGDASGDVVYFYVTPIQRGYTTIATWHLFSATPGSIIETGVGVSFWDDIETAPAEIAAASTWLSMPQTLADARNIGIMGFRVLATSAITFYVDSVFLTINASPHYVIDLEAIRGRFTPEGGGEMDLVLGYQPESVAEQLAGVMDLSELTSAALEIR